MNKFSYKQKSFIYFSKQAMNVIAKAKPESIQESIYLQLYCFANARNDDAQN
jgi:hypothetical protein